jgi:hypothetical protein
MRIMKFRGLLLLLPATGLSVAAETPAGGLTLRWQPGVRYVQRLEIRQNGLLPSKEGPRSQHARISAEQSVLVRPHERPDWSYVGVVWGTFRISGANGDDAFAYDSSRPASGPDAAVTEVGDTVRAYLGREFLFERDPAGRLAATPQFDALLADIVKKVPDAKGPVKAFFSKANITQLLQLGTLPSVPDSPVDAGASWPFETRFSIPAVGDLSMSGKCTHNGRSRRGGAICTEVPVSGRLRLVSGAAISLLGLKSASGTISGHVWFDESLGWARESETTWTVTATLGGIASAIDGSEQRVPLRSTTRFVLLRTEKIP